MNFIGDSIDNFAFNCINQTIYEYLNFKPFMDELKDRMESVSTRLDNEIGDAMGYSTFGICRNDFEWKIEDKAYSLSIEKIRVKQHQRQLELGIKDNCDNFYYYKGKNLCYINY